MCMHFAGTALTPRREQGEAPTTAAAHTGLGAAGGPTTTILLLGHLPCSRVLVASPAMLLLWRWSCQFRNGSHRLG